MTVIRTLLTAATLVVVLASCGGTAPTTSDGPTSAPTGGPDGVAGTDRAAVEAAFTDYNQALADRDFVTACALNAPESVQTLLTGVEQALNQRPADCVEAFEIVYATPGAAELADGTTTSAAIQDIAVTGDTATITWSADVEGERPTVTSDLRRIDGNWRLVDTG
ncbi:hypothetical protein [Pseudonocardia sp.]|uniref:hypothetical protein n=1 Tax=Pseudonocardia sp. TaxID=60912 RepID=UPI002630EF62|nr:hypothetical protein [Pseudonocardia sp.]